jgi:hypothetical protein
MPLSTICFIIFIDPMFHPYILSMPMVLPPARLTPDPTLETAVSSCEVLKLLGLHPGSYTFFGIAISETIPTPFVQLLTALSNGASEEYLT